MSCVQAPRSPINVDALFKQATARYGGSEAGSQPAETKANAEAVVAESVGTAGMVPIYVLRTPCDVLRVLGPV